MIERTSFVGRIRDLAALEPAVEATALVTLVGPPGIGKTRLAMRFAGLPETRRRFAGGTLVVDLAGVRDEAGIVKAVADTLELDDPASLAEALAGRGAMLLVLDNFEHLVAHGPATVGRWLDRAAELRVLATSREPLGLAGERRIEVPALELEEAIALLLQRAHARRPGWAFAEADRPVLARIASRLDRLPLALELAAARAPAMSPLDLCERLERNLAAVLGGGQGRDAASRQATLRAALDWSWALLSPAERAALAQCSVFAGRFTLEAAEAVVALPEGASALDTIQALRERSLLAGDERFHLLHSVREYARERQGELGGREALLDRHARHYLASGEACLAALRGEGGTAALERLRDDLDDLFAGHQHLATTGHPRAAARLALVLHAHLVLRGPPDSDRALLDRTVAQLESLTDGPEGGSSGSAGRGGEAPLNDALWARLRLARADALLVRRQLAAARVDLEAAAALAPGGVLRAEALRGLGVLLREEGRHDEARAQLEQALALAKGADAALEGMIHAHLGTLERYRGRVAEARAAYERALAAHHEAGHRRGEVLVRGNLGHVYAAEDRLGDAEREYRESLHLLGELGDRRSEAILMAHLGAVLARSGRAGEALAVHQDAVRACREIGDAPLEMVERANVAALEAQRGRRGEAEQQLAIADRLLERAGGGPWVEVGDVLRGFVDLARGDREAARARLGKRVPWGTAAAEHLIHAQRWLERALAGTLPAKPAAPAGVAPEHSLEVDRRSFRLGSAERVDLAKRPAHRRLLRALAERRVAAPGEAMSAVELAALAWPEEELDARVAASRIYVVVSDLRKMGLRDVIVRHTGGYLIHPALAVALESK
jgi:predicted ATPase